MVVYLNPFGFNLHAAQAEPHSSRGEANTTTTTTRCSSQSSFCALVGCFLLNLWSIITWEKELVSVASSKLQKEREWMKQEDNFIVIK